MSSRRDPVLFRPISDDEGQPPTCGLSMRLIFEKDFQGEIVNVAEVPEERPRLTQAEFAACMRDSLAQRWDRRVDNDKFLQKFFAEAKEDIKRREENSDQ